MLHSLKNVDIQRYAIMYLLDEMGIDIANDDGRIYFPENPDAVLRINDKIIRLDIGKPRKNQQYTIFNPILREDHAQFLMTLATHSLLFEGKIGVDDAENMEFEISHTVETKDDNGADLAVPLYNVSITTKFGVTEGRHEEQAYATTIAIINHLVILDFFPNDILNTIWANLDAAYAEYTRLSDLGTLERKKEIKAKDKFLEAPDRIPKEYLNIDMEELEEMGGSEVVDEDEPIPDCPESFVDFYDEDFINADDLFNENDTGEIESDLTLDELREMGVKLVTIDPEVKVVPAVMPKDVDGTPDGLEDIAKIPLELLNTDFDIEIIEPGKPELKALPAPGETSVPQQAAPRVQQPQAPFNPWYQYDQFQYGPQQPQMYPMYPMYPGFQQQYPAYPVSGYSNQGFPFEQPVPPEVAYQIQQRVRAEYNYVEDMGQYQAGQQIPQPVEQTFGSGEGYGLPADLF
jgi:hypothetical protein